MAELFFTYLRISFFASVMILAVLLVRPLLRKAPRNITCLLWLLVAVRLLIPFELESPLSLQPCPASDPVIITDAAPQWAPEEPNQNSVTDISPIPRQEVPITKEAGLEPETVFAIIWIIGFLMVLLYATISCGILRYRVRDAVRCPDGAWESDRIGGAFLLGYFRPQIYIPDGLSDQDRNFILAHERSHQKRGDHWWKLLGMVCLSIHWYNPLVWLSYALLCRDIEIACDERVISSMILEDRRSYSLALLNSGKRLSGFLAYPVAFGEISLRERIKGVLAYRKPGIRITAVAVALTLVVAVCFMTNPRVDASVIYEEIVQTTEPTAAEPTVPTEMLPTETVPTETGIVPTESTTVLPENTEPTTEPTESIPEKPTPTEPKPTPPAKPEPTPTEPTIPTKPTVAPTEPTVTPTEPKPEPTQPTIPTKPTVAPTEPTVTPTEPKPEPTQPPVTKPAEPGVTEPPTTTPTEPPVAEPTPSVPEQETIGGRCGENAVWEYNETTQQLRISGQGAIEVGEQPGWYAYAKQITSVVIDDGITHIGRDTFEGCKKITTVRLPAGLRTIGECAFGWTNLRHVTFPKTVTQINEWAFVGCKALTRITFTGNPPKIHNAAFRSVTATAYFPEQNGQWRFARKSYGGDLDWELYCTNHSYINSVCEYCGATKP